MSTRALHHPEYRDLKDLRWRHLGLNLEQAAERCGVSPRVFQRWERENKAASVVIAWLRLLDGDLGTHDPGWKGWRLAKGKLYLPEDPRGFTPGQLRALPYRKPHRGVEAAEPFPHPPTSPGAATAQSH